MRSGPGARAVAVLLRLSSWAGPTGENAVKTRENHLAGQTSPYLLQHLLNPVDWHPWGEEALAKARGEDRPIFLSIGYSACHWCHVMAHESFEDRRTADFLNAHFVCIKVDREERPDLDALYMRAVQFMTGSGGWPLTVFLTPDLRPFFGGTYFPPEPRHGMPSFLQVAASVDRTYRERRGDVDGAADRLVTAIQASFQGAAGKTAPPAGAAKSSVEALMSRFDEVDGGFGGGPKFPQPPLLSFLLDEAAVEGRPEVAEKVAFTLRRMARGGIRDQVGGGFHRYSVDGEWRVPHYEKMLYDNAQLASLYFKAYGSAGESEFLRVGEAVLSDLAASFAAPGGGFVAAHDADSEGEEGRYYLWTPEELDGVLGQGDGRLAASLFGIGEGESLEARTLHQTGSLEELSARLGEKPEVLRRKMDGILSRLGEARRGRVPPGVDTKVLTDWNALAASAFLDGYAATGEGRHLRTGLATLDAAWSRCWTGGSLHHVWDGKRARVEGLLADHAFLARAEWRAFEVTGDPRHLERVRLLVAAVLDRFRDASSGRFYDSPVRGGDAGLLIPVRDVDDGVLPSALGVMARVFWDWGRLTDDAAVRAALESIVEGESSSLASQPGAMPLLAGLASARARASVEVVVAAPALDGAPGLLLAAAIREAPPYALVVPLAADRMDEAEARRYPLLEGRYPEGRACAYVCVGSTCRRPVETVEELSAELRGAGLEKAGTTPVPR